MRRILIATGNKGKFEEIKHELNDLFDEFLSLADFEKGIDINEDRETYYENAMKKARKIGDLYGIDTLADDSGLEVAALDRRPGLHSSRYGENDEQRMKRLLKELSGVPLEKRSALFKAYLAFYRPGSDRVCLFYGSLSGMIGFEKKGNKGFGYDPLFVLPSGRHLAELTNEEKNQISHRGLALASFRRFQVDDL
jgi:XTP/dITP diphosphohydrolase